MKIRWDFVTNSSSTSFVIICKGQPSKEIFLEAMGAKRGSPIIPLFEKLYEVLCQKMENASGMLKQYGVSSVEQLITREISEQAGIEAAEACRKGLNVYIGSLDSASDDVESFFCCEAFEVKHPQLRISALKTEW